MIRRDIPQIIALEKAAAGVWREAAFLAALKKRNCIGMVATEGDQITGFVVYRLRRDDLSVVKFVAPSAEAKTVLGEKLVFKCNSHRRPRLKVTSSRKWVTDTVRQLCRVKEGSPPAILADALDDARCPHTWLTKILRGDEDTAWAMYTVLAPTLRV